MFAVIKFICVHFFYLLQCLAFRAESDLTRELQPCSANTDLIPDHKPSQLGMYSSKCMRQRGILEKNIIIQRFTFLCHS